MTKRIFTFSMALLMLVGSVAAAITLRYSNRDAQSYTFKVKIDGTVIPFVFDANKTADVTIPGTAKEALIGCACGDVKVKSGDTIEIKNGCVKVK